MPTHYRLVGMTVVSGLAAGLVVLGIGGRAVMSFLTLTLEEPSRFTVVGTLEVIGAGAAWGALTGPALLLMSPLRTRHPQAASAVFGVLVLALASLTVGLVAGFDGGIVAPTAFVVLAAVLFPLLFLVHGFAVDALLRRLMRWRRREVP